MDSTATVSPLNIDLDRRSHLRIRWSDGHESTYPLAYIRRLCPCATCRAEREEREKTRLVVMAAKPVEDMVTVVTADLVGNYAIRLVWKDGHDTGIYDYRMLRTVCPCEQCKQVAGRGSSANITAARS